METFRDSVIDKVKRPVAWIQENLKEKVINGTANNLNNNNSDQDGLAVVAPSAKPVKPPPPRMSAEVDENSKQVCEVTAKRRLAFQKSYSLEVGVFRLINES